MNSLEPLVRRFYDARGEQEKRDALSALLAEAYHAGAERMRDGAAEVAVAHDDFGGDGPIARKIRKLTTRAR